MIKSHFKAESVLMLQKIKPRFRLKNKKINKKKIEKWKMSSSPVRLFFGPLDGKILDLTHTLKGGSDA